MALESTVATRKASLRCTTCMCGAITLRALAVKRCREAAFTALPRFLFSIAPSLMHAPPPRALVSVSTSPSLSVILCCR